MNKKEVLTTLGASLLVISAFTLPQVFASGNGNSDSSLKNKPNFNSANREAIEEAITNNDYASWKSSVGDNNPFTGKITEDNFSRFAEAHRLMIQAKTIMEEMGLEGRMGMDMNMGERGGHGMNQENLTALNNAFTNNDYTSWKSLVGDNNPMSEKITAENFSRFAEAHRLLSEGKMDKAKTIFNELGLDRGVGKGFGGGRMMKGSVSDK